MNDPKTKLAGAAPSWDTYWRGTGESGAHPAGGVNHPAINAFWEEIFQSEKTNSGSPRVLDMASGDGAVVNHAMKIFDERNADFTCVDISAAAVENIRTRFPQVRGVVADACLVPLDSGIYDVITSQFGLEYAGPEAMNEATRMLAGGGRLVLLLHNRESSIYRECNEALDAIVRLKQSNFIPLAIEFFRAGFPASRGEDRASYDAAAKQLAPAVQALESVMEDYGQHVAGDTIVQLYSGVDRIHRDMQRHDQDEVLEWLMRMDRELEAFAGRLTSMHEAAIDEETFGRICTGLRGQGFDLLRHGPLEAPGEELPLAWVLVAEKRHAGTGMRPPASRAEPREAPPAGADSEADELRAWTGKELKAAIKTLTEQRIFGGFLVEAKPAWVLPFQILIGKVRERGQDKSFRWFICGAVPTDHADSRVASTPREAARYFALKWQRDAAFGTGVAERSPQPTMSSAGNMPGVLSLAEQAEALYELVEDPRVWPNFREDRST